MKNIKMFEEYHDDHASHDGHHEGEMKNYMFFQNLKTIKNSIEELINMDPKKVDAILDNGHGWALDHIATSVDDIEEVYHFLMNRDEEEAAPMPAMEEPEVVIVNQDEFETEEDDDSEDEDSDDDDSDEESGEE
jgi:hypothetical protein